MSYLWWQEAVIYQVYPRSFADSNGDGVGDLAGVSSRLDYLADTLGVDAVWISPFYRSPMDDFGYDVSDHTAVDPLFGTMEDFDRLVSGVHARGMKLIVDFVPNHTSDQHPWFVESRRSLRSPKRDWYVWAGGEEAPNNWLSVFGGSAWEWDAGSQEWYLHSFLPSQPDLNWRNPEVEQAMLAVMRFWLDRGADGFRIDVAHFVMKDPMLRDNPPASEVAEGVKDLGAYGAQDHLYDKGHDDVHGVFRRMRDLLDGYHPPRVAIGEIHEFDPLRWASYYGAGDELHMPFNFSLLYAPWSAASLRQLIETYEAVCGENWPNWVLGNHDEPRLATRIGPRRARAGAVLLLTLRGTPTIYYGEELGLEEVEIEDSVRCDPWGLRVPGKGRDGCRTPMPWSPEPGGGFTTGKPWLPVGGGATVFEQLSDPRSSLSLYRALLDMRRGSSALRHGSLQMLDVGDGVLAYRRHSSGEEVVVAISFDEARTVTIGDGTIVVSSGLDRNGEAVRGSLSLAPHEAVVVAPLINLETSGDG